MLGVDTNLLLRILTQDDPEQLETATRFLSTHCSSEEPGFVNRTVILEIVWVLERLYDEYSREQIAVAVESLLNTATLLLENSASVRDALEAYRAGADFSDALIAAINREHGCAHTATFDAKAAKRDNHFMLVA